MRAGRSLLLVSRRCRRRRCLPSLVHSYCRHDGHVSVMATIEPPIKVDPVEDGSNCELLGPTALVVQGLSQFLASYPPRAIRADHPVGVFVIGSLVIKRQLEKRKRRWKIWIWDVGKQLVGQAVVHSLNLLVSRPLKLGY